MTGQYYPANATEGAQFERSWCRHCIEDKQPDWEDEFGNDVEGVCPILTRAAVYPVDEWVYRDGQPACLAFKQDATNPARCPFTKEMFS
jgi:hypothetical protein